MSNEGVRAAPLSVQVGGGHYKDLKIQPVEFCMVNGLNFCQSSIVKYVTRWQLKGGIEDLRKAEHFACLWLEISSTWRERLKEKMKKAYAWVKLFGGRYHEQQPIRCAAYCRANGLSELEFEVIRKTVHAKTSGSIAAVRLAIQDIIDQAMQAPPQEE